jgi:peptide/nickel transport system substrate-binding protein
MKPDQVRAAGSLAARGPAYFLIGVPERLRERQVVAAQLNRVGVNIDDQVMDWGTVLQRRFSREPLSKGGWSLFVSVTPVPEYRDPLAASLLRGNGGDASIGLPDSPRIEAAYNAWLDSDDAAEQTRLEREIQLAAFESVPFIPLGRYMPNAAWSSALSHPLKGPAPVFWNVSKSQLPRFPSARTTD